MNFIANASDVIEAAEKIKGFWDETGLDMHIAVKLDGSIAVSTKHWSRVHYVVTGYSASILWTGLGEVSDTIGRKLVRSTKGPYVYISKLSNEQTQTVFNKIVERFNGTIERRIEWSWNINDAYLPEF